MPETEHGEDLDRCPRERPFWCAHPHCLWCNWDDFRADGPPEWNAADLWAAHLGERPPAERRHDPRHPETHYAEGRRYVAWLCGDCAAEGRTARWFRDTVLRRYPQATIVRDPRRAG
jgi:hypothetical protein